MRKPNYDEAVKIVDKVYNTTDFTKEQLQPLNEYLDHALGLEAKHEVLIKYVARFMVLLDKYLSDTQTTEEMYERWELEEKLRKVGKEE